MAGMLRLKDEKALEALLAKTNLRPARGIVGGQKFETKEPLDRSKAKRSIVHPKAASEIEELLASQIRLVGNLPEPTREYQFLRGRAHRLDFAWPTWRYQGMQIGIEVQGMVHRVKGRFSADLEKRALALLQGWAILEVGGEHIRSGRAMEWLQELFTKAEKQ